MNYIRSHATAYATLLGATLPSAYETRLASPTSASSMFRYRRAVG